MGKDIRRNTYSLVVIILFILSIGFAFATFYYIGVLSSPSQTYIGTIAISNYEENQYSGIIASDLLNWKEDSEYVISYQNFDMDINFDYFDADISATINQLSENEVNSIIYTVSDANKTLFTQELSNNFTSDIIDLIDVDSLIDDIFYNIGVMSILSEYNLIDYFGDGVENTILNTLTINNLELDDVNNITNNITQLEIQAESRFYLLDSVEFSALTNNQLSILASGIQKVTSSSNLSSYIFEQNNESPSWALEGMNVRILQANGYDFSFYNDYAYSMSLEINKNDDSSITISLIGYPFVCDYITTNTQATDVSYGTLYQANELIDENTPNVIVVDSDEDFIYRLLTQIGINGRILRFEKTVTNPDGTTEIITIYYEEYEPITEIYQENIISKDGE